MINNMRYSLAQSALGNMAQLQQSPALLNTKAFQNPSTITNMTKPHPQSLNPAMRENERRSAMSSNRGASSGTGRGAGPSRQRTRVVDEVTRSFRDGQSPDPDDDGTGGAGTHRSTNKEVEQESSTIFKINAAEWNNVPRIVHEAVYTIVGRVD